MDMPSSVISNIKYNAASGNLDIRFTSGNIYRYKKVPAELYTQMIRAFSKGKFFNTHIKGLFEYEQLKRY
ncbi:KTSC domain-containing protein [Terrimonas alba]|uniref:KTSC domain-containing protein n=1 Tax=Terrimonas alba TaxID=3349636 RepID=UPI0035F38F08